MSKDQFLAQLTQSLGQMSEAEKAEIIYDYEEHFHNGLAEGKTAEEVAQSLGNPRTLGNSYRINAMLDEPQAGKRITAISVLRAVFASLSLTFFNLLIVLGPFLALVGVLFGLWIVAVSIGGTGLLVFVGMGFPELMSQLVGISTLYPTFMFFVGLGLTSSGILAVIGMWKLSEIFFRGVAAYVKFNVQVIGGVK